MQSGFFGHAADAGERLAFAPPQQPGLVRAFALAIVAHLLLVLALMHGLQWKRETQNAAAEAELWSAVPQQAAPPEVIPPPPPPAPVVKAPPPQPEPPVVKAPEPPQQRDADIAVEREKQKRELQKKKLAEERALEKKLQAQEEREERRKLEARKKREQEVARQQEEAKAEKAEKAERAKVAAADAKRREDDKRRKQEQDTKKMAQMREDNMKRMQGLAGGSGAPSSGGSSAQSSGPSAGWAGRVQARVRPNIVFSDDVSGNPKAEVEVRTAPDGTIVGKRLVRSSGVKAWDEAVLRALDKTEVLPRDVDGRVPTPVIIGFRPKD